MDSLENLRVLEGSEVFFRGLQHLDSPVQIRSAPLLKASEVNPSGAFLIISDLQCRASGAKIVLHGKRCSP